MRGVTKPWLKVGVHSTVWSPDMIRLPDTATDEFWDDDRQGGMMEDITVEKATLIEAITANRKGHRAIFEEAVEGYKEQVEKVLEERLAEIRRGQIIHISVNLPLPQDHTRDYDRVLKMLEMSVDETVTLDETTFAMYVMDDWNWKHGFLQTNSAYSASARAAL